MAFRKVSDVRLLLRRKVSRTSKHGPKIAGKSTSGSPRPAELRAREFEALIRARDTVLLLADANGRITSLLVPDPLGVSFLIDTLAGSSLAEVFDREAYSLIAAACHTAHVCNRTEELGCLFQMADHPRWMLVSVDTCQGQRRNACGFKIILQNSAIRARMRVQMRPPSALLDQAIALSQFGTWEADFRTGIVLCSERFLEIVDGSQERYSAVSDLIWTIARECYKAMFGTVRESRPESFDSDFEIRSENGDLRVVHSRTVCLDDRPGLPMRMAGVIENVTANRALESKSRNQAALLSAAEYLSAFGTWEMDVRTGDTVWSDSLFNLLELPQTGTSNQPAYLSNLHPEDRARVKDAISRAINNSSDCAYRSRYRTPGGDWRTHETLAVPVRGDDGSVTHFVGVVRDVSEQTRAEQELHRLSQCLMRARDEERRLLARELHESAGQSLAALKMTLGNLREALPNRSISAHSLLESCAELTEEAVREVRTVSYLMHPPMLDESGLASAVRWYARGFSERSNISVTVDIPEDFGRLHPEIETAVFRLIQEALTNIHRYSGSRTARIYLVREKSYIRLEVTDAGRGIPGPMRLGDSKSTGVGIAGMRERVHELNGIFQIETAPGRGTTVRALFPSCSVSSLTRASVA